jgi:hypothetical protein
MQIVFERELQWRTIARAAAAVRGVGSHYGRRLKFSMLPLCPEQTSLFNGVTYETIHEWILAPFLYARPNHRTLLS